MNTNRLSMVRLFRVALSVLLAASAGACPLFWGELENPVDPYSQAYQGFESVDEPDSVEPADTDAGTVSFVPTLVSFEVVGASAYQFQIASSADFAAPVYTSPEASGNSFVAADCPGLEAGTAYYWRVRVKKDGAWGEYSARSATFTLSALDLGAVSPAQSSETEDSTPTLDWADAEGADGYELLYADSAAGLASAAAVDVAESGYTFAGGLGVGTWYWRVRAKNAEGAWGACSETRSFAVLWTYALTPSPADGTATTDSTPLLAWDELDGASGYQLQYASSLTGLSATSPIALADPSYQVPAGLSLGTWYWRVRAKDADGVFGAWRGAWALTVRDYQVGDVGPAGGLIFYDKGSVTDGWRFLEAAPADQSAGIVWGDTNEKTDATDQPIGSGESNTSKIILTLGSGSSYAARLCDELVFGGYDDWFLPSYYELWEMYDVLKAAGLGGFASANYWGSSEHPIDPTLAIRGDFSSETFSFVDKTNSCRVRAARAF